VTSRQDETEEVASAQSRALSRCSRALKSVPADLVMILAVVILTAVVTLAPFVRETPLRIAVGLGFVLFVPGYALVAALYPGSAAPGAGGASGDSGTGVRSDPDGDADGRTLQTSVAWVQEVRIDGATRVALSFGVSVALVPLVGIVVAATPWGVRKLPVLVGLGTVTLFSVCVATYRRWALSPDERFRLPYREWLAVCRSRLSDPPTRTDAALNVGLVLALVLAAAAVGYAGMVPQSDERFSEFSLLVGTDDGDVVAEGYPTEFVIGESRELVVAVGNREHRPTNYTVVVELQRVGVTDNATAIEESARLGTFDVALAHEETWHRRHAVTPTFGGNRLRLQYLLYRGQAPAEPTVDTAYRETHLWINVTRPDG
jgi:uncharacterized membrane protein